MLRFNISYLRRWQKFGPEGKQRIQKMARDCDFVFIAHRNAIFSLGSLIAMRAQ
jgi:hypothetical protein